MPKREDSSRIKDDFISFKQQPASSFVADSSFSILKTNCLSSERDGLTKFLNFARFLPRAEPAVVGVDVRVAARTVCAVELRLRGRGLLHSLVREWVIRPELSLIISDYN